MSYFDVPSERRFLAPAEINPSFGDSSMYSSLGNIPSARQAPVSSSPATLQTDEWVPPDYVTKITSGPNTNNYATPEPFDKSKAQIPAAYEAILSKSTPSTVVQKDVNEGVDGASYAVLSVAGTVGLVGAGYAGYKGYGVAGAIGSVLVFGFGKLVASIFLGPYAAVGVDAYATYKGYQAYKGSLWLSRTSPKRPSREPTGKATGPSPPAPQRRTPCSTRSARPRLGRSWTT